MNIEQTGGASGTESTERDDFTKAEARLDEIKTMNMGDMSDDDLENVMAERKALRTQKEEMMGSAQEEANAENQERSNAEKMAVDAAEVAKAEAEATAQAEKAKQIEERKQTEATQIEALTAEIKGVSVEKKEAEIMDEASAISAMVGAAREYRSNGDRTNYDAMWAKIPASIKMGGLSEKLKIAMSADIATEKLAKTQAETIGQESAQEKPKKELQEMAVENVEEKLNNANLSLMSLFQSAGYSSFHDKVSEAEKSVIGLPEGEQEKLAEKFFEQTIGKNIMNNKGAYQVYAEIGGAFHKKFKELEDARLKSAGYSSGFTI